jgi:hypothetical protein
LPCFFGSILVKAATFISKRANTANNEMKLWNRDWHKNTSQRTQNRGRLSCYENSCKETKRNLNTWWQTKVSKYAMRSVQNCKKYSGYIKRCTVPTYSTTQWYVSEYKIWGLTCWWVKRRKLPSAFSTQPGITALSTEFLHQTNCTIPPT